MYSWLWRHLPGPWWMRVPVLVVAAALLVWVLFEWFFPWIEPYLPFQQQTVEG